jgi:VanZ family protein
VENVKRWAPVVLYAALIFYLSAQTGSELPRWSLMRYDKVIHACEYAGFAFLWARALGVRRWYWAVVACMVWALSDEFHQTFVAGRSGNDPGDLCADLVGSLLGTAAFYGFHRLVRRVN